MNYKESILEYCRSLKLDTVGFTQCRCFNELKEYFEYREKNGLDNEFEEKDIDRKINPNIYMEEGKTIISIAFPYIFNKNFQWDIGFSKYTHGMDYHRVVSIYLEKICEFIEKKLGGKTIKLVDSNSLPERYIAKLCGIGFIGKNNMLITKKYGSYVFLGEIITDIYIEKDVPIECKCDDCDLCQKACPTGAIKQKNDSNICLSYITQKKEIKEEWFDKLEGRIFGCDTCQKVCPFNEKIEFSSIKEFKPYKFMEKINMEELINITKKTFMDKYSKTSCGWRGKNVIQRNILINIVSGKKNIKLKKFNSPYIQGYYNRLLKHFKL